MMKSASLLLLGALSVNAETFMKEAFDSAWEGRWSNSAAREGLGKFIRTAGRHFGDEAINMGIQTSEDAKFYGISRQMDKPFLNKGKKFAASFSVKHEQGIDCGGGYIKILPETASKDFTGDSKYWMMFGPDICGHTKKIHLIFGYKGRNLEWKKAPKAEDDKLTHVYTVVVNEDNTYEVQVDGKKIEGGNLADDWDFLLPKEIDDPEDKKPIDWVDEAEIADPEDKKPADWGSEPETIADPEAEKPEDWDEEDDGEWEAPTIPNPKFQGEWKPKMIPNPAYKGVWKPKTIPNPDFEDDTDLYLMREPVSTVGIDLWQVKSGSIFDNIIISDNVKEVEVFVAETWGKTYEAEKEKADAADKAAADAAAKAAESEQPDEEDEE
eukprot:TRINITY_DN157_c1_g1_i1.p1 TRINITY_DN157_c1_g1~~TRINITY_DN157_c1_g1_i1.p1  ORF type:complete len:382 (+),score=121.24 TRINITY_DN157_c1_g1_i1:55-1200(+)